MKKLKLKRKRVLLSRVKTSFPFYTNGERLTNDHYETLKPVFDLCSPKFLVLRVKKTRNSFYAVFRSRGYGEKIMLMEGNMLSMNYPIKGFDLCLYAKHLTQRPYAEV